MELEQFTVVYLLRILINNEMHNIIINMTFTYAFFKFKLIISNNSCINYYVNTLLFYSFSGNNNDIIIIVICSGLG